jgi:hypothetical protein
VLVPFVNLQSKKRAPSGVPPLVIRFRISSRHFSACCQILAEVESSDNELLIKHVRNDIMKLAPKIAHDQKCRAQNKSAAMLAMMSVDALKGSLKTYEKGRQLYLD